jgi:hypothetical protein
MLAEILLSLLLPVITLGSILVAIRHGPLSNRWWKGENVLGFTLFVGGIAFLVGFVGPIIVAPSANQGPLLGIFYTGPIGFCVGLVWGLARAASRRN